MCMSMCLCMRMSMFNVKVDRYATDSHPAHVNHWVELRLVRCGLGLHHSLIRREHEVVRLRAVELIRTTLQEADHKGAALAR